MDKKFKGIIFDFNGTIFLDSPYHERAWIEFAEKTLGRTVSKAEYYQHIHGSSNGMICKYLYGKELSPAESARIGEEKESVYRSLCLENKDALEISKGGPELFAYLNAHDIPHAIATSAEIRNVEFFKELFSLTDWFGNNIIYDDGTVRGKPDPDIYLKTGAHIGVPMEDLIVVEDAHAGLLAARRAGAGLVVGIAPYGKEKFVGTDLSDLIIKDFTELPTSLFR